MSGLFGKWLIKSPARNAYVSAIATLPVIAKSLDAHYEKPGAGMIEALVYGWPAITAFLAAYTGTIGAQLIVQNKPTKEEISKLRSIEEKLDKETPPQLGNKEEQKLEYSLFDLLRFLVASPSSVARKARQTENPLLALDAAIGYFCSEQNLEEGLLALRDAKDWLKGKKPKYDFATKLQALNTEWALAVTRKLEPVSIENYIFSAAYESIAKPEHAWYWSALAKALATEQKKEATTFHALLSTAQNRDDQNTAWAEVLSTLQTEPLWEQIGETRNIVRKYNGSKYFSETLIFKEKNSRDALLKEAEAGKTLETLAEDLSAPEPLHITDTPNSEGRYTYIMRYVNGETLYNQLSKGNKDAMPRVIKALAKIHATFPTRNLPLLDLEKRLREKIADKHLNIPEEIASEILANYNPVLHSLKDTPWAWNKDAHPENWIIGKKISAIDCELEYQAPVSFDLANLLEYGNFFTLIEKRGYIAQYAMELSKEGKQYNIATSIRTYCNSVIHRMLSLTSAWSSPERQRMRERRKDALDNALKAIDIIKEEEESYFRRFERNYLHLRRALSQLKTIL